MINNIIRSESILYIEIGLLLLSLGLLAYLAIKIKFSVVPIFLLTGLFIGNGGLFDVKSSDEFLKISAEIGAVLLLLLLGLEYTSRELFTSVKERKSLGIIDIIINFTPGVIMALILDWGWLGVITLGGISYVSSSGIASEFIRDAKLTKRESTKRAVSILVIEDLFLALYLPILSAILLSVSLYTGLITTSLAFIIVGLALMIGAREFKIKNSKTLFGDNVTLLLIIFGAAVLASGLANYFGFSGAIAAFLLGLLISGDLAVIARVRLAPLRDLFAAMFFLFFGINTDPAKIPSVILYALLFAMLSLISKAITAKIASKDIKEKNSTLIITTLLNARGEFSLLIATIATVASFGEELQALTISYVLTSTIISSIMLKFIK
jgi:CPA2 family monovalent cation:H+ antiporter-2